MTCGTLHVPLQSAWTFDVQRNCEISDSDPEDICHDVDLHLVPCGAQAWLQHVMNNSHHCLLKGENIR